MNIVVSARAKKDLTKLNKGTLKQIKLSLNKLLTRKANPLEAGDDQHLAKTK